MQREFMTSDEIYDDMCLKIEKLKYMPGEKLSESELCEQYHVSRHVVRTAITRLKERKLITVYPQRGTFVSLIDMPYIEQILYLREASEQEAIRRLKFLPKERRDQMIAEMRAAIADQQKAMEDEVDMDRFYEIDTAYHACLHRAVGKENIMEIISDHYIHVRRWRNFELGNTRRQQALIREHIEITDAIESENYKKAHEQMHFHLNTVKRLQYIFEENSKEYFIFKDQDPSDPTGQIP